MKSPFDRHSNLLTACLTLLGTGGTYAQFPLFPVTAGQDDTSTLAVLLITVKPKFQPLFAAGYPGWEIHSPGTLTSPVLVEPMPIGTTSILKSNSYVRPARPNPSALPSIPLTQVGTSGNSYDYGDFKVVPPAFTNVAQEGRRECLTEVHDMVLVANPEGCHQQLNPQDPPESRVPIVPQSPFVFVSLNPSAGPSIGLVQELAQQPQGGPLTGQSFFNIYVCVNIPGSQHGAPGPWPGASLYNKEPLVITNSNIIQLPPTIAYIHGASTAVPLHFKAPGPAAGVNGITWKQDDCFGYMILSGHLPNVPQDPLLIDCPDRVVMTKFIDDIIGIPGAPAIPMRFPQPGPPLISLDFEELAGGVMVNDRSGNDHHGIVGIGVSLGVAGAPFGSTPGAAGRFSGGIVSFPSLDASVLIRDNPSPNDGSYTMACWLRPTASSIGGDHCVFGQQVEGINHGLRNFGTLHAGHWGTDVHGNTGLTADQWVHVAWTYDGLADSAQLFLGGKRDGGPFNLPAPNGSGQLVLGGRNGQANDGLGEAHFDGDIDDLAIWNEVLLDGQIASLADGANPMNDPGEDSDRDGLLDGYEFGVAGNLGDLDGDDVADLDNDGLSDLREFRITGTDPTIADSDGDTLSDGVETNTGEFVDANDTGTDPLIVDTDGDGHSDGDEVAAPFSDPNDPDDPGVRSLRIADVSLVVDPGTGVAEVTVTWASEIGAIYSVDWSEDLLSWNQEDDSVPAGAVGLGTYTFGGIPAGTRSRYFRVSEQ